MKRDFCAFSLHEMDLPRTPCEFFRLNGVEMTEETEGVHLAEESTCGQGWDKCGTLMVQTKKKLIEGLVRWLSR